MRLIVIVRDSQQDQLRQRIVDLHIKAHDNALTLIDRLAHISRPQPGTIRREHLFADIGFIVFAVNHARKPSFFGTSKIGLLLFHRRPPEGRNVDIEQGYEAGFSATICRPAIPTDISVRN